MSIIKIQGKSERQKGIYYEFDSDDTPLGEGGMGKVYKGRCVEEKSGSARAVAIKFMYSDLLPYAIEKARRESAIQFRHDNLVEMLGFIETESKSVLGEIQRHYHVVSELLEGVSLDSLLEGKLTDQRGISVPYAEKLYRSYQQDGNRFAVEIVKNILKGLMSMHDAGYIHRDIDPTNIMITTDGHIKLIDFGIAKKMNLLTTNDKHLTQAGQFVGKPEYAAPELVLGAIHEQNQTTDIYAVGILLFQLIVGHTPFEGDRSDILQKQLHSKLPLNLVKHRGLRKIIAKATEKSRSNRFQSAAEFRVALDNLIPSSTPSFVPYIFTAASVAAVAVVVALFFIISDDNSGHIEPSISVVVDPVGPEDEIIHSVPTSLSAPTYASAVAALHNAQTAGEGLRNLETLADNDDAKAAFLLSRLYFKSLKKDDYCPDSIIRMQRTLHIQTDNMKAHELLKQAVKLDSLNYQAKYELACDYWSANQRTAAVPKRDADKAGELFASVRELAISSSDKFYKAKSDSLLKKVETFKVRDAKYK